MARRAITLYEMLVLLGVLGVLVIGGTYGLAWVQRASPAAFWGLIAAAAAGLSALVWLARRNRARFQQRLLSLDPRSVGQAWPGGVRDPGPGDRDVLAIAAPAVLRGARVVLRPIDADRDAGGYFALRPADESNDVVRGRHAATYEHPFLSLPQARHELSGLAARRDAAAWAAEEVETRRLLGWFVLGLTQRGGRRVAGLGFRLRESLILEWFPWRPVDNPLAREALELAVRCAFDDLLADEVEAEFWSDCGYVGDWLALHGFEPVDSRASFDPAHQRPRTISVYRKSRAATAGAAPRSGVEHPARPSNAALE